MGFRLGFILFLLLLAFAMAAESFSLRWDDTQIQLVDETQSMNASDGFAHCDGAVGDCITDEEEMMMDSETNRRSLAQRRYISYGALRRNQVPCNRRGRSYYNCQRGGRANPYRRGCSVITRCHRYTD